MATSVELQQELNELMAQASSEIERQNKLYRSQAEILGEITKALKNFPSFKDKTKELDETADALKRVSQSASHIDQAQDMFNSVTEAVEDSSLATQEMGTDLEGVVEKGQKLAVLASVASVAAEGLRFTANAARGLVGFAAEAIGALGKLALSVIGFPFKVLSGLIHMADSGGGSNELQQSLEDIRKEFGYLDKTAGGAIVSLSRSMGGELANTGLSVNRVFGNLADRLKYVAEYAKALGPVFDTMATRLGEGGVEALGAYNKALGLTAEAQKGIAARAMASGRTVNEVNQEIANYSIQLSEAFGVTMKEVSRSVGEMMHDFEHFGHLAPKELTQVAVYARKLGIEVKSLAGIMDKTLNFEDAATQAAQLSQAFGLNIDAMAMMREQDPGKQLEMLRKSFFATGRSIETMTRQERRLLSQQTGLDDAALGLAFSLKNQGVSYDQIARKGDAAKKKQLTQAEALEKLSGAIERLVQSGSSGSGGFFDRFLQGFEVGIKRSREFREIMMNLRRALNATYRAGIEVGKAFVEMFPGVKNVFKGIAGFFEPTKFKAMLAKVVSAFKDFFRDLSFPGLVKKLKSNFETFLPGNSEAGKKLLDGAKSFFRGVVVIVNGALKLALQSVTKGLQWLLKLLTNPKETIASLGVGKGKDGGFLAGLFHDMTNGMGPVLHDLGDALSAVMKKLFDIVVEKVKANSGFLLKLLGGFFAPSAVAASSRAVFAGVSTLIGNIFLEKMKQKFLGEAIKGQMEKLFNTSIKGAGQAAQNVTGAVGGVGQVTKGIEKSGVSASAIPKIIVFGLVLAALLTGAFFALKNLLLFIKENRITKEQATTAAIAMAAMGVAFTAAAVSVGLLQKLIGSAGNYAAVAVGVVALIATTQAMIMQAAYLIEKISGFNTAQVGNAAAAMKAISVLYLAATASLLGATVVGAIITASEGLAVVAIAAGLVAIAATAQVMVEQAMSIIQTISRMPAGSDLSRKADVFLRVVQAIGSFASSFGAIINTGSNSVMGSIQTLLSGGNLNEQLRSNLGAVSEVMTTMGTQIRLIIRNVSDAAAGVDNPEAFSRSGQTIATLLSAVGSLMNGLKAPTEVLQEGLLDLNSANDRMQAAGNYMEMMQRSVRNMFGPIQQLITDFSGMNLNARQVAGLEPLGHIITAVAHMMSAFRIDGNLIKDRNPTEMVGVLNIITQFTGAIATSLSRSFTGIQSFITTMVGLATGITPEAVQRLRPLSDLVSAMFNVIGTVMQTINGALERVSTEQGAGRPAAQISAILGTMLAFAQNVIPRISAGLPAIIGTMLGLANSPILRNTRDLGRVRSIGELITTVSSIISSITQASTQQTDRASFQTAIEGFLSKTTTFREAIPQLATAVDFTGVEHITQNLSRSNLRGVSSAITEMVSQVNSISREMANLTPVNLDVGLRRLAQNIGVGNDTRYEIRHRNFTINVNLQVKIDAAELEKALIERANSRFARLAEQ